jgi:class 3 adenylate cyclase
MAISRSNAFLRKHDSQEIPLYVIFVDIVGSTKLSAELSPHLLSKLITIYSQEMAYVMESHGGYVLKYVGDAVLGYFPPYEKRNDCAVNIVNCATKLVQVVKDGMNPVLIEESLPGISIKATADYGNNSIVRYGSDKRRAHIDIISFTMNVTAKMQSITKPNQIAIGREFHSRLDPEIQGKFREVSDDHAEWNYHAFGESQPYKVFAYASMS